jgi:DNA-binding transcriptional regulator YiaG
MAGRHPFSELRAKMSPAAQKRAAEKAKQLASEMDLAELRHAFALSQEELAHTLGVQQAAVAKIEKRADMLLSTLSRFVEAMGGTMRIVANFAGRDVCITNLAVLSPRWDGGEHRTDSENSAYALAACSNRTRISIAESTVAPSPPHSYRGRNISSGPARHPVR